MSEPTQAQIEAAAKAMEQCMFAPHELPLDDELHGKYLDTARAALTAAGEAGEPQTSAEYHQRRGAAWDIIDQAICDYDAFMLNDDYDAQDALNKIIAKMKERRSFYLTAAAGVPDQEHISPRPGQKPDLLPNGNTAAEVGDEYKPIYDSPNNRVRSAVAATIERCAQYHDKAAEDCEKIAAVNMDNKLGADCLTRAQDHREDADAIRALKDKP